MCLCTYKDYVNQSTIESALHQINKVKGTQPINVLIKYEAWLSTLCLSIKATHQEFTLHIYVRTCISSNCFLIRSL